jgi:DNA-binding transcriptional LysR family regulator
MALMIKLVAAGAGVRFGMEDSFQPAIARGELVPILEEFCPRFPGFFLFYPSRRNMAPKLRVLMKHYAAFAQRPDTPNGYSIRVVIVQPNSSPEE